MPGIQKAKLCTVSSLERVIANAEVSEVRYSRGPCTPSSFLCDSDIRHIGSFLLWQDSHGEVVVI